MNYFTTMRLAVIVAGLLFMTMRDAQAYIDPGSTSYFFQLLIAGLTGVVFFFSSLKRRVTGFFRKKKSGSNAESVPGNPPPPKP